MTEIRLNEQDVEKINKLLNDLPIHTLSIVNQIGDIFKVAIDREVLSESEEVDK